MDVDAYKKKFGKRLGQVIKARQSRSKGKKKYSKQQLIDDLYYYYEIEVLPRRLNSWIEGTYMPPAEYIRPLAKCLGCSTDCLLNVDNDSYKELQGGDT